VLALGVDVLTPVSLTKRPERYGDRAGLLAAQCRPACRVRRAPRQPLLQTARARSVVVAFTVQGSTPTLLD